MKIYIGYDSREAIAFHACTNSIIRNSTEVNSITPLALINIKKIYSERHTDGSNEFIYSRFLVPYLNEYKGWAIFIDGDMIVRTDINDILKYADTNKAILCVKHDYKTKSNKKYLGASNDNYPRKNWSSVILWNCEHKSNSILTPEFVERSTGKFLHRFSWLNDQEIGSLPIEWNWLPDEFGVNQSAKLLHWTLGTPCFIECANSPMSDEWHKERILTQHASQL